MGGTPLDTRSAGGAGPGRNQYTFLYKHAEPKTNAGDGAEFRQGLGF